MAPHDWGMCRAITDFIKTENKQTSKKRKHNGDQNSGTGGVRMDTGK